MGMKNKFMAAAAVVAILTATGAHAQTADIAALKAQSAALKKQNAALEARLNKLEKEQVAQAKQAKQAPQGGQPAATSFMAADLPSLKGIPQCALPSLEGPLTFCGITIFGTVDAGLGYASSGLPMNGNIYVGDQLVNKYAHASYFGVSPNNMAQTTLGIKGTEEILPGLSGVFMASTGLNPQSGRLSNAPGSIVDNQGLNRNNYSLALDGGRGGQAFNDQLYVGLASKDFGQLTFGRHRTFTTDMVGAYDATGGSYAFSVLTYSGAPLGGLGDTADARWDDSFKYRVEYGPVHLGAMYKFAEGNSGSNVGLGGEVCPTVGVQPAGCTRSTLPGSPVQFYSTQNDAAQFNLGGSYGGFDVDGVLGYFHQAISTPNNPLSSAQLGGASNFTSNASTNLGTVATNSIGNNNFNSLAANASDNTGGAIGAKYTWNQFKFFAGWSHDIYHNPANNVGIGAQNDQGGYMLSSVNNFAFPHAKLLDTEWAGVRYSYDPQTELVAAYYHEGQNNYGFATNTTGIHNTDGTSLATCGLPAYLPNGGTVVTYGGVKTVYGPQAAPRSATCAGTLDAVSGYVDYHFTKRFDLYAGFMYSVVGGGMAAGYYNVNNFAPTAGARFTF
jgi:predicted porin